MIIVVVVVVVVVVVRLVSRRGGRVLIAIPWSDNSNRKRIVEAALFVSVLYNIAIEGSALLLEPHWTDCPARRSGRERSATAREKDAASPSGEAARRRRR
jgi:hypothetical protein